MCFFSLHGELLKTRIRVLVRTAALISVAWGALSACVYAAAPAEEPFSYPGSLLAARSTYTVSPATPVVLGNTEVVLEQSRLMDVAAITSAPVYSEGSGENARRWLCVQANNGKRPLKLWFIASGQDTVTEAQMQPGSFQTPKACGSLSPHFEPVYLSGIASGMTIRAVSNEIGPASHKDANGWHFWVSLRSYTYNKTRYTEYVWVGAHADKKGVIDNAFTTQLTR